MRQFLKWFRLSSPRPTTARRRPAARPALEALESREVRTVGFSVSGSALTVNGDALANTINLVNDGNGLITATGIPNYPTAGFSGITTINVNAGDGADTIFYDQGTATSTADLRRNLTLNVDLGDNGPATRDVFSAKVNGDIGFTDSSGQVRARSLFFNLKGGPGSDRITVEATQDVDVRLNSTLRVDARGGDANDLIAFKYQGQLEGNLFLELTGENDNDSVSAELQLNSGSIHGRVQGAHNDLFGNAEPARVRGDLGNDVLVFTIVKDTPTDSALIKAEINGGLGLFDNDRGAHTSNVTAAFLEDAFLI